jgi:hypothetical protein
VRKDLQILHQCHNTRCVNPHHMRLGKNPANQREAAEAGRRAKKLTEGAVISIHEYARLHGRDAWVRNQLAQAWHVSRSTIDDVIARRTWRHVNARHASV